MAAVRQQYGDGMASIACSQRLLQMPTPSVYSQRLLSESITPAIVLWSVISDAFCVISVTYSHLFHSAHPDLTHLDYSVLFTNPYF